MGTCYTYLLYDDFDWGYQNKSKAEVIEAIKKDFPVATILGEWYHYIVVDLDKNSPFKDHTHDLKKYCDSAYYYGDGDAYNLREMEFKVDPKVMSAWLDERYKPPREETEANRLAAEARVLHDTAPPK